MECGRICEAWPSECTDEVLRAGDLAAIVWDFLHAAKFCEHISGSFGCIAMFFTYVTIFRGSHHKVGLPKSVYLAPRPTLKL
jgi:hypothetical protein